MAVVANFQGKKGLGDILIEKKPLGYKSLRLT